MNENISATLEDTAYTFAAADFGFSDAADGNSLAAVHIMDIPLAGNNEVTAPLHSGVIITQATDPGTRKQHEPERNPPRFDGCL